MIESELACLRDFPQLRFEALGAFASGGSDWSLPRFTFGAQSNDSIRIGIFAGIHGDEPAGTRALIEFLKLLSREPSLADDYLIHAYPICNPTGFARGTRYNHLGLDLNREFWKQTSHPEVQAIERELREQHFHGLIQLHADDTSDGIYGFVRGHTLSENLLKPALVEAAKILPRNINAQIDGFAAKDGIIYDAYEGVLAAPPQISPVPFELILETPHHAPIEKQVEALVVAMRTVLDEYRRLMAFAANL
ncbi:MAG TPA: succinylglutamate desuccinylase/aspartoacylase family protein [Candidatus Limnocylindria bacterium]|nr:succinylglutamate desuccinylase/aspartoacylase family protein [Candidatus Limnocylindria bacterium]